MTSATLLLGIIAASLPPPAQPIRDNSFLLEEAYNQEDGVVQHVSTFARSWSSRDWSYIFTQEWPAGGMTHQLSVSVPFSGLHHDAGTETGIGDLALNYRYQLVGGGEGRAAVAPRLTLMLPTGAPGHGGGSAAFQLNLPVSVTLSRRIVAHANAGLTYAHSAENAAGDRARAMSYNLGLSAVWLAARRFNVLLEAVAVRSDAVVGPGLTEPDSTVVLSPGIRWSHDFANGLQIVPGIACPLTVGHGADRALLLYLSFEHPFRRALRSGSETR
jgi:hypothetical protein